MYRRLASTLLGRWAIVERCSTSPRGSEAECLTRIASIDQRRFHGVLSAAASGGAVADGSCPSDSGFHASTSGGAGHTPYWLQSFHQRVASARFGAGRSALPSSWLSPLHHCQQQLAGYHWWFSRSKRYNAAIGSLTSFAEVNQFLDEEAGKLSHINLAVLLRKMVQLKQRQATALTAGGAGELQLLDDGNGRRVVPIEGARRWQGVGTASHLGRVKEKKMERIKDKAPASNYRSLRRPQPSVFDPPRRDISVLQPDTIGLPDDAAALQRVAALVRGRAKWFEPHNAGVALQALGALGHHDAPLIDELLTISIKRLDTTPSEVFTLDFARILHGLAALHHAPPPPWLDRMYAFFADKLPTRKVPPPVLATVGRSLAQLALPLPPALVDQVVQDVAVRSPTGDYALLDFARVLAALARMRCALSKATLASLAAACPPQLMAGQASPADCAALVWSVGALVKQLPAAEDADAVAATWAQPLRACANGMLPGLQAADIAAGLPASRLMAALTGYAALRGAAAAEQEFLDAASARAAKLLPLLSGQQKQAMQASLAAVGAPVTPELQQAFAVLQLQEGTTTTGGTTSAAAAAVDTAKQQQKQSSAADGQ